MSELFLGTGEPTFQHRPDGISRVFVQLSENAGCPIGCKYCYIPNVGKPAMGISPDRMHARLAELVEHPDFSEETLVSLGCDTDPFLDDTIPATLQALKFFNNRPNPLQIATKLRLPPEAERLMHERPETVQSVVLSTSITTIAHAERIEPGAPSAEERAHNLDARNGIDSLAILKPYRRGTIHELPAFTDLFSRHTPVGIIMGGLITHAKSGTKPFALDPTRWHTPLSEEGYEFSRRLQQGLSERGVDIKVWHSAAVAAIALHGVKRPNIP